MSNKMGGSKYKRYKKRGGIEPKSDMPHKDGNMLYAQVTRKLGGKRLEILCDDGNKRQAIISGKYYKRVWFNAGDILLVAVENNTQDVCSIEHKYSPAEIHKLRSDKAFNFNQLDEQNTTAITFGDPNISDDESDDDDNNLDNITIPPSDKTVAPQSSKKDEELKRNLSRDQKQSSGDSEYDTLYEAL